jgi:hypothetical protein
MTIYCNSIPGILAGSSLQPLCFDLLFSDSILTPFCLIGIAVNSHLDTAHHVTILGVLTLL